MTNLKPAVARMLEDGRRLRTTIGHSSDSFATVASECELHRGNWDQYASQAQFGCRHSDRQTEEGRTVVEFGFQLGNQDLSRIRDLAQAADELRFDVIGFADHLIYEGPERQMDPKTLVPDAIGVAAMAAAVTRRIRIGHLVLCNLFRHPAFTAQALSTLDNISGGRMFAGLGTGWTETEFRMMNMPFPPIGERLEMLDESIQCIKSLWSDERANFRGKHYQLSDAVLWPKPVQKRPPILLGRQRQRPDANCGQTRRLPEPHSARRKGREVLDRKRAPHERRGSSGT